MSIKTGRTFRTAKAAEFLTEIGKQTSPRTLQAWRLRGADDPGECGPTWYRDPVSGDCYYFEQDLRAWKERCDARLIERGKAARPSHLDAAA